MSTRKRQSNADLSRQIEEMERRMKAEAEKERRREARMREEEAERSAQVAHHEHLLRVAELAHEMECEERDRRDQEFRDWYDLLSDDEKIRFRIDELEKEQETIKCTANTAVNELMARKFDRSKVPHSLPSRIWGILFLLAMITAFGGAKGVIGASIPLILIGTPFLIWGYRIDRLNRAKKADEHADQVNEAIRMVHAKKAEALRGINYKLRSLRNSLSQGSEEYFCDDESNNVDGSSEAYGDSTESSSENVETEGEPLTPYSALGIPEDSPIDIVTAQYKKLCMQYHPDKVANLGDELKRVAEMKMKEINEAYAQIKKRAA